VIDYPDNHCVQHWIVVSNLYVIMYCYESYRCALRAIRIFHAGKDNSWARTIKEIDECDTNASPFFPPPPSRRHFRPESCCSVS
jgi:hypothetical protein